MIEIKLGFYNEEIIRSIVYSLERILPQLSFSADENSCAILGRYAVTPEVSRIEADKQVAMRVVSEFNAKLGRIAGRVKSRNVFALTGPDLEPLKARFDELSSSSISNNVFNGLTKGSFVLGEEASETFDLIEKLFYRFSKVVGAKKIRLPHLLSTAHLKRCGYLPREQHQTSFLCSASSTFENFSFQACDDSLTANNCACLSPALCLSAYPVLGPHGLGTGIFTAIGPVHRYEGGVFSRDLPLSRLWEFHCSEVIVLGSQELISEVFEKFASFTEHVCGTFGFKANLLSASDLFFHPEYGASALHQLINNSKMELRVDLGGADLAVASFNNHGRHFVDEFSLDERDLGLQTACLGFGLERWVQAMIVYIPDANERRALIKEQISRLEEIQK